jgi:hypothetical protein
MTEFRLGDHLLAFDGRALEVFGYEPNGASARYHVSLIENILMVPDLYGHLTLNFSTRHGGILGLKVPTDRKPEVEALVKAVSEAKAAYKLGQNP